MIPDGKLRKREHILKSADFRRVYKLGRWAKKNSIVLYCLANDLPYSRIGFSISSKYVKNAVSRNRIRRVIREAYRTNKAIFKNGIDMVVVVKADISANLSYDTAKALLITLAGDRRIAA